MRDLGTLGGTTSFALALNNFGQVAGFSRTALDVDHAFLYTGTPGVDGAMIDLDAWLDANYPIEGANWTLTKALGLNDTGFITGYGTYDDGPGGLTDGTRAFLLDASALVSVPEPACLSLLTLGGATLLPRRRPQRLVKGGPRANGRTERLPKIPQPKRRFSWSLFPATLQNGSRTRQNFTSGSLAACRSGL
jgi:probable HAF family extracellular repeat protein